MKQGRRNYTRQKRKQQILKQLRIWNENGYATEATSYKLAKALDLVPAQTFRDLLNEMVAEGDLARTPMDKSGRLPGWFYSLVIKTLITEKYGKRRVNVKRRGEVVGSLEVPAGQLGLWSRESKTSWESDHEWDMRERAKSTTGENLAREQYMDAQDAQIGSCS